MRGIARGQRIHVFVIPEVAELVRRELSSADIPIGDPQGLAKADRKLVLQNIAYWLIVNSMRTERVQYSQLCLQNVSNVWRKQAYKTLFASSDTFLQMRPVQDERLLQALRIFKEDVNYDIEQGAPQMIDFGAQLRRDLDDNRLFVVDEDGKAVSHLKLMLRSCWSNRVVS